ncbi:MAG: PQQ-binding-like beta-propeller repeat protein [Vicinamibacterales bacterium]
MRTLASRSWSTGFMLAWLAASVLGTHLQAQDWTGWRGPNRDGIVQVAGPAAWPEMLNPQWSVPVGEGYANPLFANDLIFQFARQGDDEVAMAIDPADGTILWRQSYSAAEFEPVSAAARHGKGPFSTPTYADGMLYTFGATGVLTAVDAASGDVVWRHGSGPEFESPWVMFGNAMSPVVSDGLVVVVMGTNGNGAIAAYDTRTGAERWTWRGDGPAYASPIVVELDGVRQVVSFTERYLVGLSLESGDLLWQLDYPARSGMNIPTPMRLAADDTILAGTDGGIHAVRVTQANGQWSTERTWENGEILLRFSTPVQKDDVLFGFSSRNRGMFFAIDAGSGATLWTSEPRQGDNATVLLVGDSLVMLKNEGELIVAEATGAGFRPVRRYQVSDSATYAHPLLLTNGIVVKDDTTLSLLSWE